MRVLVTDGDSRAALAVTRSLGRAGHEVIVGEWRAPSLAGVSRHCAAYVVYPDPLASSEAFVSAIAALVQERGIEVILPITDVTTFLVTSHADRFEADCTIPFADAATIARAADKVGLMQLAMRLGVPVPETVIVCDPLQVPETNWPYPIVIKPRQSRVQTPAGWVSTTLAYAGSRTELLRDLAARPRHEFPLLLQERIAGSGMGVFACYDRGRPVALFSHRRLRERPPWGGVSVLSESVQLDPRATRYATQLLDEIGWQGVAMVEFKVDERDGTPRLMEINGRFWGSLQLSIDAGVDFPAVVVQTAERKQFEPQPPYRVGVRSRWLWGDFDRLLLTFFAGRRAPASWQPDRLHTLLQFLKLSGRHLYYDNPKPGDVKPWLLESWRRFQAVAPAVRSHRATSKGRTVVPAAPRSPATTVRGVRIAATLGESGLSATTWNALLAGSHTNSIFQTYQWNDSWWRTLGRDAEGLFVTAFDGTQCVGVAPMALHRSKRDRVIRFAGTGRADYCDFIVPRARPEVLADICDALAGHDGWDVLQLSNIPSHSPTVAAIRTWAKERGYYLLVREQYTCPTLLIEGHEAEARAIANKASLRRRTNFFESAGRLTKRDLSRSADVQPLLDLLFAQHTKRWEGTGTPSLFVDRAPRDFYRCLTHNLDGTGWLLFSVIELDGLPLAMHYGFDYGGSVIWYKPSFDAARASHSPGLVMVQHLLLYAIEQGRREFDFTVGDEDFKRRFTNSTRTVLDIRVYRDGARYIVERSRQQVTATVRRFSA